jgi:hypothetical protein
VTRTLLAALGLTLLAAPALGQERFLCPETAAECTDPLDDSTCTTLLDLRRRTPEEVLLRTVHVTEGPHALFCAHGPGGLRRGRPGAARTTARR